MIEPLKQLGSARYFPKGTFLFQQHHTASHFFMIEQGLVKAYYETRDGKEFIKSFICEGGFIASMQALVNGGASPFTVLSLEDCHTWEIPRTALLQWATTDPVATQLVNSLLLQVAMKKEQREYELLCLSPEERCILFYQREGALASRLSQIDIARYLGITPVALSRIRKRCNLKVKQDP